MLNLYVRTKSKGKKITAIFLMVLQVLIRKCADTDMLVCNQFLPQDGVALEEIMVVVTVVVTHTAQHIAEAQPAVIQTVTKS